MRSASKQKEDLKDLTSDNKKADCVDADDANWSQRPTSQFGVYVSTTSMTYIFENIKYSYEALDFWNNRKV